MEDSLPPLKGLKLLSVGVCGPGNRTQRMEELYELCEAAGAQVVCMAHVSERNRASKGTLDIGKPPWLFDLIVQAAVEAVVIDDELTPLQQRELEAFLEVPVVDRTGLILRIFSERARSREARMQVKLARSEYVLPRLAGMWEHLDKEKGGIGLRGAGEKQIELDRRQIRRTITRLRRELDSIDAQRQQSRSRRRRDTDLPHVAIVGYTNAGKTSLMNLLASGVEQPDDRLFATLHPIIRKSRLPRGGEFYVLDTVGFVDRLPDMLVTAFRATLRDVSEADILIHVVDASDPAAAERIAAVNAILGQLGAGSTPMLYLLNKIDQCDSGHVAEIERGLGERSLRFSCVERVGIAELFDWLSTEMKHTCVPLHAEIPYDRWDLWDLARRHGIDLDAKWTEQGITVAGWIPRQYSETFLPVSRP